MFLYLGAVLFYFFGYAYVCIKEKRVINMLLFPLISIGLIILLPHTITKGFAGSFFSFGLGDLYLLFYFTSLYFGVMLIELRMKPLAMPRMAVSNVSLNVVLFALAIVAFFWVFNAGNLITAISNPRMFYANNRIGGGIIYYVILPLSLFCFFGLLSRIGFSNPKRILASVVLCILFGIYLYVFGQKSLILQLALIAVVVSFYTSEDYISRGSHTVGNRMVALLGVGLTIVMLCIFSQYFLQQNIMGGSLFDKLLGYSDYLRNFNLLVSDLSHFRYGQIIFEDNIFSFIPRALWSDKPMLFGSLGLGLEVPELVEWTEALTGAPSFGPIGAAYADFGFIGVVLKLAFDLVMFAIAKTYEYRLETEGFNFFNLWLFLTFCGVQIFYITLVSLPIYQLSVIALVYFASKRFQSSGEAHEGSGQIE